MISKTMTKRHTETIRGTRGIRGRNRNWLIRILWPRGRSVLRRRRIRNKSTRRLILKILRIISRVNWHIRIMMMMSSSGSKIGHRRGRKVKESTKWISLWLILHLKLQNFWPDCGRMRRNLIKLMSFSEITLWVKDGKPQKLNKINFF